MKILDAAAAVDKDCEFSKRFQPGSWTMWRATEVVLLQARRDKKKKSTLLRGWTSVIPKMWSSNHNLRSTKEESCSEVTLKDDPAAKSDGCHCKSTRVWWTTSRRSIWLDSGNDGGCSQIAQNCKVKMSMFWDTSSTTASGPNLGQPLRTLWSRTKFARSPARSSSIETWMGESTALGMSVCSSKTRIIASGLRGWCSKGSKKSEFESFVGEVDETGRSCRTNALLDHVCLRCTNLTWMQTEWKFFDWRIYKDVLNHVFFLEQLKSYQDWRSLTQKTMSWSDDMECHAKKSALKYFEVGTQKDRAIVHRSQLPAWMIITLKEELESVGELSKMCSQIVLTMLVFGTSLVRSHNGQELVSLFSRLSILDCVDSSTVLLETLRTLNQPWCESYVFFGSRTFVSHNLDPDVQAANVSVSQFHRIRSCFFPGAGLRMDGVPPLYLWDVVIEVLHSSKNTHQAVGDRCWKEKVDDQVPRSRARSEIQSANANPKLKSNSHGKVDELSDVDHVVTSAKPCQCEAQLYNYDDNEAVIKMIIKCRSPTIKHVVKNPQSRAKIGFLT